MLQVAYISAGNLLYNLNTKKIGRQLQEKTEAFAKVAHNVKMTRKNTTSEL